MRFGGRFRGKMSKGIDQVECCVVLLFDREDSHIPDKRCRLETMPLQSSIAIFDGLFIQVIARDFIACLGELDQQSPRAACRFENALYRARRVFLKALPQKAE